MIAIQSRIRREGEIVQLAARQLTDMSADIAGVGERDQSFPLPHGHGEEFQHGGSADLRGRPPKGLGTHDVYMADLHIDRLRLKPRSCLWRSQQDSNLQPAE